MRVSLTLGEAVFGVTKPVKVQTAVVCPKCSGKGGEPGSEPVTCGTCDGNGEVTQIQRSFLGDIRTSQLARRAGASAPSSRGRVASARARPPSAPRGRCR